MTRFITNTEANNSYFWVQVEEKEQDLAANKTVLLWACGVTCGFNFYNNAIRMDAVTIDNTEVYSGGRYSDFSVGDHQIANGELEILHEKDGTKTVKIASFEGWLYANHDYYCDGGSVTLTPIPRQATITAAADFTDLENPSISISNPSGAEMNVWLEPYPEGKHLCVRENIPNTGSYTWTLTDEERNSLREICDGNSCTVRIGLYSKVDDVEYVDYRNVTFKMTENDATRPNVSIAVSPDNGTLPDKFAGMYIQGKSKVTVSLTAEGKFGASITGFSTELDGQVYSSDLFTSSPIQGSGEVNICGKAKDSRGFTGTVSSTIQVKEYSKPLVIPIDGENAILCYRSDDKGNRVSNSKFVWVKAKYSYYNLGGENGCALQYRWKEGANNWSSWSALNSSENEYNGQIFVEFDETKVYSIQLRAIDELNEEDVKTFEVPTEDVALHLGRDGKNVTIGSYCDYNEVYTFRSAWKAIFDKDVVIDGNLSIGGKTLEEYIKSVINGG